MSEQATSVAAAETPARPAVVPARREWTNFRLLLAGQTVSLLGTAVNMVALPIVAVLQLNATTFQVGLITSSEFLAYSVLGLLAGVYVDRWRRRSVLLWSDAMRTVIVATVPVLWLLGALRIWHLMLVALLVGVFKLFFDTAHQAYLPSLVSRDKLIRGNAALQTSSSTMELAGPGIGGMLVQAMGAALALLVDAASYVVSFIAVLAIRAPREDPAERAAAARAGREAAARSGGPGTAPPARPTIRSQIAEGFRYISGDKILRSFLGTVAHFNVLITAEQALLVIFLLRVVRVSPVLVGLLLSATGVGAVVGALSARRVAERLGVGRTMVLAAIFGPVLGVLIPLTDPGIRLAFFVVGNAALGATTAVLKVVGVSYRQAVVPPHLIGRVVATNRVLTWGPLPLGGLLGGGLGQAFGSRTALLVIALMLVTAPLWLLVTPVWRIRELGDEGGR
jgi:MFS family permease